MKKKNPSFGFILGKVLVEFILGLILAVISAGIGIIQVVGGEITMINTIPIWIWFSIPVVIIVFIFIRAIQIYVEELESSKSVNESHTQFKTKHTGTGNQYTAKNMQFFYASDEDKPKPINEAVGDRFIDIVPELKENENGMYARLKVTPKNKETILCKAMKIRLERKNDKKHRWDSIDKGIEFPFSWHEGGTDDHHYKELKDGLPQWINVAKIKELKRYGKFEIEFLSIPEKRHLDKRYRICIDVECKKGTTISTERWMGCVYLTGWFKRKIVIKECNDTDDWK